MHSRLFSLATMLAVGVVALVVSGCALLAPLPEQKDVTQRLAAFPTRGLPLEGPVTIHWSELQIPFIEAERDGDAAFALGLVHAHLRLGQMATVRMIARGRVSEMIGPLGVDIDRGLRTLDYGRAAAEIELTLDEPTRLWVQRFVDGINHYQNTATELPHDFGVLALEREPWTIEDVFAMRRLVGTDVNWLVWMDLLPLRARAGWDELWARLVEGGAVSVAGSDGDDDIARAQRWLGGLSKSGSNSVAVAGHRTDTGGALMANDPHLGILVPNVWLIAGVHSPSYHAVGLMAPGLPIFAIGRNPHIAWGGTNMRAASSDLYDVSAVPASEIDERQESIGVRWWFDSDVTVRETRWGPIVSDVPLLADMDLPPLALKWTGHDASDEIGAMLAVSRARTFAEFRTAFEHFAVPGQNMLYADADGNIGRVLAVHLPGRGGPPADIAIDTGLHDASWSVMRSAADLPYSYNPEAGYLVSANDRPPPTDVPVGFFFSPDDRVDRMHALITAETAVGVETLKALQQDVYMASSVTLRDLFLARLDASGMTAAADADSTKAIERLRDWDGANTAHDSIGAVTFEQFRHAFTARFYSPAPWRGRRRGVRLGRPAHGATARGHRRSRRGNAARGARRRAGRGRRWPRVVRRLGRHAPAQPRASALQRPAHRRALRVRRSRRRREFGNADEDRAPDHRRTPHRELRVKCAPHFRHDRPGRELFRPAGRAGRLVQQHDHPGSVGALAARRLRPRPADARWRARQLPPHAHAGELTRERGDARSGTMYHATGLLLLYAGRRMRHLATMEPQRAQRRVLSSLKNHRRPADQCRTLCRVLPR